MSWIIVADVGGADTYHVGDEAMLAANVDLFQGEFGLRLRAISEAPAFTAAQYGVEGAPSLGFGHADTAAAHEARLAHLSVQDYFSSAPSAEHAALFDAMDGLVISGGGNLNSTWPALIYERCVLARWARRKRAPIIITGQTIGPHLTPRHRGLVREILDAAIWVGAREQATYSLCLDMGVPGERLVYQEDDAAALTAAGATPRIETLDWIALTLPPAEDCAVGSPTFENLVEQLKAIIGLTSCRLIFIPHAARAPAKGAPLGDLDMGHAMEQRLGSHMFKVAPLATARETAATTASAVLTISGRYHPLVFALAAGRPAVGIWQDEYTRVKLLGALGHYGRQDDLLSLETAARGGLYAQVLRLWTERDRVSRAIQEQGVRNAQSRKSQRLRLLDLLTNALQPPTPSNAPPAVSIDGRLDASHEAEGSGGLADEHRPARRLPTQSEPFVTPDERAFFHENGYLPLGALLSPEQAQQLADRSDAIARREVAHPAFLLQRDTGGAYEELPDPQAEFGKQGAHYRKIEGLENDGPFRVLMHHEKIRRLCAMVYGAHTAISTFRAMVMNKPAEQGTTLPWHQDGGDVWGLDRDPLLTIWVALDPATVQNGCMEAVAGSHKLGLLSRFGSTLSEENAARHCEDVQRVFLEAPAGHAFALHNWLIHRSGINPSPAPRRAFTMCCIDARSRKLDSDHRFPILFGERDPVPDPYIAQLKGEIEQQKAYSRIMEDQIRRAQVLFQAGVSANIAKS